MFSEWIRRSSFWVLDFMKGSGVRKHYNDIHYVMENNNESKVQQLQKKYLLDILKYSTANVEYYKPYKSSNINGFPVINKNIIKENYNRFQSPEYKGAKVIELHTSGSTGTPFVVRQDINKRNRVYAEMMYFWGKAGYKIGMKYVFFRIWTEINRKSRLSAWARNIIMHDILRLDEKNLESVRNMLKKDKKIKMLISYASTFDNLANYLSKVGDTPEDYSVKTVISSSEVLKESTRGKLKEIFGCNVVSLYSNQENGTLAIECTENTEFHVNNASYYIEFLKLDSDEPAELGELARIVVTDLFNHAMPLIRYDTGDIAIVKENTTCGWSSPVLSAIQGRLIDCIYDTKGEVISPLTITNYMWPFDKILQFQFIQEDQKEYTLNLNGAKNYYNDKDFEQLFKKVLGEDAIIQINHLDEIPVLKSGKRKMVVCNYNPNN